MPTPAQCGLRIAHDQHDLPDGRTCPGKPWPKHYDPRHCARARYKPELNWTAEASPRAGKHRAEGDARLVDEPHPPRPWLRLGWRDDDKGEDGCAVASWVVSMCMVLAAFTGMSATSVMTSFDQLLRTPVLIAKKECRPEGAAMTLTEFLLARIAEDEDAAQFWLKLRESVPSHERPHWDPVSDWPKMPDSARVLAECEAKRSLIDRLTALASRGPIDSYNPADEALWCTLRTLATVYADHPDFGEEWRA